jgi:hypothetical protein
VDPVRRVSLGSPYHKVPKLIIGSDDPWNQTAADNAEWLLRFKRDVGILPADSGPGLGSDLQAWSLPSGGTGFAPPYVSPNPQATIEPIKENSKIFCSDNTTKPFQADAATVNHYLQSFKQRYPAPAKVFCYRELENGLTEYVKRETSKNGVFPSDDQLRERAREIMGMQKTPADDPVLLKKFKAVMQGGEMLPTAAVGPAATAPSTSVGVGSEATTGLKSALLVSDEPSYFGAGADLNLTDQEVSNILQDMNEEFGDSNGLDLDLPEQGAGIMFDI